MIRHLFVDRIATLYERFMQKRVITTARYRGDANEIFQGALNPAEAAAASAGYTSFKGMPDRPFREGETYVLDVTTLRVFKTKGYKIHMHKIDHAGLSFESHEKGGLIKSWVHLMSVKQDGDVAIWTDDVTLDAGWLTPIVARIAAGMYRHRHKNREAVALVSKIVSAP